MGGFDTADGDSHRAFVGSQSPLHDEVIERRAAERVKERLFGRTRPSSVMTIGRYRLEQRLGLGSMGVVYRAWDRELGRHVAMKLVRMPESLENDAARTTRLVREARALARLSHPNVVTVFDVGHYQIGPDWPESIHAFTDGIFFAMELVEGVDVREWLAEGPHPWREVLRIFVEAGRGLAAAHARGLAHRDFKPANVLLGRDGRARVLDFGLATACGPSGQENSDRCSASDTGPSASTEAGSSNTLSESGLLVGTPAYMAPEQHHGDPAGSAADQYSFCVALYEGLYGQRPFCGSMAEVRRAKRDAAVPDPTSRRGVPKSLHRAIVRGLASRPADRHADMNSLLRILEDALSSSPSRVSALLVLAGCMGIGGTLYAAGPASKSACDDPNGAIATIWSSQRQAEVHEAVASVDVPFAAPTWASIRAGMDDFGARWAEAHGQVCRARAESTVTAPELDLRMRCLRRSLREAGVVIELLSTADREILLDAVNRVEGISPPDACVTRRLDELEKRWPTKPEQVEQVEALHDRLATVAALQHEGSYDAARTEARLVYEEAERLRWPPLIARALLRLGLVAHDTGDYVEAESFLRDAYHVALEAKRDDLATSAATHMMMTLSDGTNRFDEAMRWSRHAEAIVDAADPLARARWLSALSVIHYRNADYDSAIEASRRAHETYVDAFGDHDLRVATAASNLAGMLGVAGRGDESLALHELAVRIREETLGASHPDVAQALNTYGATLAGLGRLEEALEVQRRAAAGWEASLGSDHPLVAMALNNLATTELDLGHLEVGRKHHARALEIREARLGPDHVDTGVSHMGLGTALAQSGDLAGAVEHFRRSLVILRAAMGDEHPYVGLVRINLGGVAFERGELQQARAEFEEAVRVMAKTPRHPFWAMATGGLGLTMLELGDATQAVRLLEQAIEVGVPDPEELAKYHFGLARALSHTGAEPDRARQYAERALELSAPGKLAGKGDLDDAEVQRWLDRH